MRAVLVLLVLIAVVPMALVVVNTSTSEQSSALEKATTRLNSHAQLRADAQKQLLAGIRHMLTVIGHVTELTNKVPGQCSAYLRDLNEHFPQYKHLAFADATGNLVCGSAKEFRPVYIGDRQYFTGAVRTGRFTVGEYLVSRITREPTLAFSLPVHSHEGELLGVQYAAMELTQMQEHLAQLSVPASLTDVITDWDGTVLAWAGERAQQVGQPLAAELKLAAAFDSAVRRPTAPDERLMEQREDLLYAVQPVRAEGAGGFVVVSMMPKDGVLQPVLQQLRWELTLLLLIAVTASLIAWRTGDRLLADPVDRLLRKISTLQKDGPAAVWRGSTGMSVRELGRIERGIDDLALALLIRSEERERALADLREQKNLIERSERRYRAQFEDSPQPMWVIDSETSAFLAVNDAAVQHYGYSHDEFGQMTLGELVAAVEGMDLTKRSASATGTPPEGLLARHRRKDGQLVHVEAATHELDWDGRSARMMIVYDVTNRVLAERSWQRLHETLEQRVAQRTHELELANRELEAFSYSVSHDLRGPLKIVDGFCGAVLTKHGKALPEQASHYLQRIRAGVGQMNMLISDLLSFAQTGRTPLVLHEVDLARLAASVVEQLRQRFPDREVSVQIESPLIATCDPHLLAVVLENLIGNAWKYTARTPNARISIRHGPEAEAEAEAAEDTYVISDNGAGFDMAYAEKLFKPFQRLHSVAEFEGTGVGLAIVYRIIQRHGGRVWADSRPQAGASFYFALPHSASVAS